MHVPEIIEVKEHLELLKSKGLIQQWELPYENLLTRRSAAIFFIAIPEHSQGTETWNELEKYDNFSMRVNSEKKLSQLAYRITFSKEEKEKNEQVKV